MNTIQHERVLGIAPTASGFGFALFESSGTLVDWGVKTFEGDKNKKCLRHIKEMIYHYTPDVIVLQNYTSKDARRSARIRKLGRGIIALAKDQSVDVRQFSREQIKNTLFTDGQGTKYEIAENLAKQFPDELGHRLPAKRKAWMSEDYRMGIFDAVALCVAGSLKDQPGLTASE